MTINQPSNPAIRYLALPTLMFAILLTGCSSDTDDGCTYLDDSVLNGIWNGDIDSDFKFPFQVSSIIYAGDLFFIGDNGSNIDIGSTTNICDNIEASINSYEITGSIISTLGATTYTNRFFGSSTNIETTLVTSQINTNSINASYQDTTGDQGSIRVAFSNVFNTPSSLPLVDGNWSATDNLGQTTTINIASNGSFSGSVQTGNPGNDCSLSGQVSILDNNINVYDVSMQVGNCNELNGQYDGYASVSKILSGTQLKLVANSQGFVFYAEFQP
ncbi:MAG: hypothetical protein QNJ69_08370 [Gammaproteobacteria bacterium]|nr:hypothetical protein [Gammaproteobacteria bacterium]